MDKQKLNTYLGSLNVPEPLPPTLESLRHLQAAHLARYAFQSLSTVLGEPVSLAEDDIFRKTVQENWGGYCYELNLLFAALLQSLGFVVRPLTGSIVHDNRPDMPHARTHMMLEVKAAGDAWLVDVGFGGLNPTAPLRLDDRGSQLTPHGAYRIEEYAGSLVLSAQTGQEWRMLYRFDLQPQFMPDLEVGNWYVSTHPKSPFRTRLMAARATPNGERHTLLNRRYTLRRADGSGEHTELPDARAVLAVLHEQFLLSADRLAEPKLQVFLDSLEQASKA
ncbi:arylamine N-acetyltransferase [Neisseria sp.]|uniref:arylamine N-acetyltransferase family protein n=1 Tax=Neisseria sp. TaxID=192066 RepID=UPI0028A2093E|nr:arylamine N-acetyltransferase [Neisseria sp.]